MKSPVTPGKNHRLQLYFMIMVCSNSTCTWLFAWFLLDYFDLAVPSYKHAIIVHVEKIIL